MVMGKGVEEQKAGVDWLLKNYAHLEQHRLTGDDDVIVVDLRWQGRVVARCRVGRCLSEDALEQEAVRCRALFRRYWLPAVLWETAAETIIQEGGKSKLAASGSW